MSLLGITLVVLAVWVVFTTCVRCVLKAAKTADESEQRRLYRSVDRHERRSIPPAPERRVATAAGR